MANAAPDAQMLPPEVQAAIDEVKSSKKLPARAVAIIRSEFAKVRKSVSALSRFEILASKLDKRLVEVSAGRIPQGTKPWKPSTADWMSEEIGTELADPLAARMQPTVSFDDAKKYIYLHSLRCNLMVNIAAVRSNILQLTPLCSLDSFVTRC